MRVAARSGRCATRRTICAAPALTAARELVETVRRNVSIDWMAKETVRARLRAMVRRVLPKHGCPPDKQEKATQTVLAPVELIAADWAA